MIPNDQPLRKETLTRMITTIYKGKERLNDWELTFIKSVLTTFNHRGDISIRQGEIIERIYDMIMDTQ